MMSREGDIQAIVMIRILFKQLLDEKSFKERRRITLAEVSKATGISRATLTRVSNVPGYNANIEVIDALCKYFSCTPGELLEFIPDDENQDRKESAGK